MWKAQSTLECEETLDLMAGSFCEFRTRYLKIAFATSVVLNLFRQYVFKQRHLLHFLYLTTNAALLPMDGETRSAERL